MAGVLAYDAVTNRWSTLPDRIWIPGGAHALRYQPTAEVESLAP